jgi:hypothetical protein
MPRLPLAASVVANTIMTSATGALVMKFLVPFSTQRSPSLTARVRCAFASDPASGSDSAKQPIIFPTVRSGSQRARWASSPSWRIGAQTSEHWTDIATAVDAHARAISSSATA